MSLAQRCAYDTCINAETGTIASLVVDLALKRVTVWAAFTKGCVFILSKLGPSHPINLLVVISNIRHWENPTDALGDKRNPAVFARWKELAKIGSNVERNIVSGQATIERISQGKGDFDDINPEAETI